METEKDELKRRSIILHKIKKEAANTFTYQFKLPEGIQWTAGANAHFTVPESKGDLIDDKRYIRHLSIISSPEDGYIEFTTRIKKEHSEYKESLSKLKVGDSIEYFKIQNRLPLRRDNRPVVLISMGVAMSTMRPLIHEYINNSKNIPRIININIDGSRQYLYKKEFDMIQKDNCEFHYEPTKELFFKAIQETFAESSSQYYIAGSDTFLKDIAAYLLKNDVNRDSMFFDVKESKLDTIFSE